MLLLQRAFWLPTALGATAQDGSKHFTFSTDISKIGFPYMPEHLLLLGWLMLGVSLVVLVLCQLAFRRLEGKFAERL